MCRCIQELPDIEIDDPVRSSSIVPGTPPPRPEPTGPAGTRRNRDGTPVPRAAPDAWPPPSGRPCPRRSAMPSILVPPPCCFGISTARTGGGKYVPDDIRFQILYRVVLQIGLEAGDGLTVHPWRALICLHLPEGLPDLPLRNIKRLALRLQLAHAAPPRPTARLTGRTQPRTTLPLGSAPVTGASQLLRAGPPARPATVLSPSRFRPLGRLPLTALTRAAVSSRAFSRSTQTQQTRLTSPLRRTPPGQSAGTRQAHPGTI